MRRTTTAPSHDDYACKSCDWSGTAQRGAPSCPQCGAGPLYLRQLRRRSGPRTRFPNKSRSPYPLCLPPALEVTLQRAADRVNLSKSDVLCLLIEQHADTLRPKGAAEQ